MTQRNNLTEISTSSEVFLLMYYELEIFEIVNVVVICGIMGLFGMAANIINMIVFAKQGLNTTINISLFSLSLSDFAGLISLFWLSICFNPLFKFGFVDAPIFFEELGVMTGAWPHACFARFTCWLTAYITAERYFCIAFPLKSKQIITPKRTACVMCCVYVLTLALLSPQYMVIYLDWGILEWKTNYTRIRVYFKDNLLNLESVSYVLNTANGVCSFTALTIFTVILMVKLRQQMAWRKTVVAEMKAITSKAEKEKKTIVMILMLSSFLICCYAPGLLASLFTFIFPDFSMNERNKCAFGATWTFFFILETLNSSSSIFFYYKMSTKYKKTFIDTFGLHFKNDVL